MEMNLWAISAFAWLIVLAFISRTIFKPKGKQVFAPGPKPWPIIGNLNLLGTTPHQSLHLLSKKYGHIMQLKFGKFPVVIASSPEMAREFLQTHDSTFASRPALAAGKYTAYNFSDVTWSPYGPYWRQARKIYLMQVFSPKRLESFEHIRVKERRSFMSRICALSGKPFVLRQYLCSYTLSTISRMVLSDKYFSASKLEDSVVMLELQEMLDEWFFLGGAINIGDWIPWLSYFDIQGYVKRMKVLGDKLDRFLEYVIEDHQTSRDKQKDFVPRDLVDVLLEMAGDPNLEVKLTRNHVKGLIQDLLAGGTDTSATTVEWAIQELLMHPQVMETAKEELDRVIGRNRWVEESDLSELPYIDAIIKECLRLHPLATLLAPHYAIEDCKVAGYDILKGTTVFINTWSVGRDQNLWDNAEEFLPERFLGKDFDMTGQHFALLPFGSGRRRCPGYNLGLKIVRSTLANLIHGFNWRLVGDMKPKDICMEELYGLTTHPKVSMSIVMEPALPLHMYEEMKIL